MTNIKKVFQINTVILEAEKKVKKVKNIKKKQLKDDQLGQFFQENIIKKYIPDGQKAKAIVMERSDGEDWNSFRRRFAACRI
jgi:radical SAM superfamily enzyme with C-terminal helix-hairpin-helix motif